MTELEGIPIGPTGECLICGGESEDCAELGSHEWVACQECGSEMRPWWDACQDCGTPGKPNPPGDLSRGDGRA